VLATGTSLIFGSLLALGISKGAMLAYWYFLPQTPRGDELSTRGDLLILARSCLGSLAAVALARAVFLLFRAPVTWTVVLPLALTFLAGDLFLFSLSLQAYRLGRQRLVSQGIRPSYQHDVARISGDLLGFLTGTIWLLRT
jgi:hypothetical protein